MKCLTKNEVDQLEMEMYNLLGVAAHSRCGHEFVRVRVKEILDTLDASYHTNSNTPMQLIVGGKQ